ncbi:MAG: AAA family ATPase [Phycisphaeraceae bacterium]
MLIHELKLNGLLSFGPDTPALKMRPLNILIGPNGSGKSNLVEAIGLLRSAAKELTDPIRGTGGGGVSEWIWKGSSHRHAHLEAIIDNPSGQQPLRHVIEFTEVATRFELVDERIENTEPYPGNAEPYFYYKFQRGRPVLNIRDKAEHSDKPPRYLKREDVAPDQSIIYQRKDPDQYPELAYLADTYSQFRLYREWTFGRSSVFRQPQSAGLPNDRLAEDFSNLGMFLNRLQGIPKAKNAIIEHLRDLYQGLDDFGVKIQQNTVEVWLSEGSFIISANRLSDGTLRYLCLLAILFDPNPPPLICIEEPELGLHPDMLPGLADLLVDASERTQLIVSTHSDILVDAMSEQPESVVVFEKHDGQTQMKRLETNELQEWLKKYRLGHLWMSGEIGGKRW